MSPGKDDPTGRQDPVDLLTESVQRLEARVEALEDRIAEISGESAEAPPRSRQQPLTPASAAAELVDGIPVASIISAAGQACLVLCGAFLLRALTGMEVLPVHLGLLLGAVYALVWLLWTDHLGGRGQVLRASFYGASAAVIAFPLVWEAVRKYEVVAAHGSAAALVVLMALTFGVVWRRDLAALAWIFTIGTIAECVALTVALRQPEPFAGVLILAGAATAWMAHGRQWGGVHWLAALVVDAFLLLMIFMAVRRGGPPESYANLSAGAVLVLCLAFLLMYLGSFAGQTLLRKRDVTGFEILQTGALLLIGLGGAVRVAEAMGKGTSPLAGGALVVALACYAVAFSQTKLRWEHRRNFMFYAWLAFVLALVGCHLAVTGIAALVVCCALSVSGAVLGDRYRRVTLHYHGAGYLIAAAYSSGLAVWGFERFVLSASEPWSRLTLSRVLVMGTALTSYVVVAAATVDSRRPRSSRIPRLIIALVAVAGCGGALVGVAVNALGSAPPDASPALVAAVRSVILAASTIVLAATSRLAKLLELRWVVYLLLVCSGFKLVVEDLRHGTPIALFAAFGAYGLSLIVSPRLVRGKPKGAGPPTETTESPSPSSARGHAAEGASSATRLR